MKKNKDLNFFKNFLDLIPDPLIAVKKNDFLIEYINQEGEIFFSKSSNYLLGKSLSELFYKNSYFLGYLKKLVLTTGVFLLFELTLCHFLKYFFPKSEQLILLMIKDYLSHASK